MGRRPCCAKVGLNRGTWTVREDKILTNYVSVHGEGKWRDLPLNAGLKRCGKSCRLRWLNYLKPDIKRGNITEEEEELIVRLHKLLGNRWSLIAGRLPGRTDNEIKNYWNTKLSKRTQTQNSTKKQNKLREENSMDDSSTSLKPRTSTKPHQVVRTKAVRLTKIAIPQQLNNQMVNESPSNSPLLDHEDDSCNFLVDFDIGDLLFCNVLESKFQEKGNKNTWNDGDPLRPHEEALELKTLASFLDLDEDWIIN